MGTTEALPQTDEERRQLATYGEAARRLEAKHGTGYNGRLKGKAGLHLAAEARRFRAGGGKWGSLLHLLETEARAVCREWGEPYTPPDTCLHCQRDNGAKVVRWLARGRNGKPPRGQAPWFCDREDCRKDRKATAKMVQEVMRERELVPRDPHLHDPTASEVLRAETEVLRHIYGVDVADGDVEIPANAGRSPGQEPLPPAHPLVLPSQDPAGLWLRARERNDTAAMEGAARLAERNWRSGDPNRFAEGREQEFEGLLKLIADPGGRDHSLDGEPRWSPLTEHPRCVERAEIGGRVPAPERLERLDGRNGDDRHQTLNHDSTPARIAESRS